MKISAYKVEQAEALAGSADAEAAQGRWWGHARCLDDPLSIFSRAVLSVYMERHGRKRLSLHSTFHQGRAGGEVNYLNSLGRSNRQDLFVLILKY